MKRKMFLIGLTVVCGACMIVPVGADAEETAMTHGQLAQMLAKKLGLDLPPNPSDMECMMALSWIGIFPSVTLTPSETDPAPGWSLDPDKAVTLAELAVILVRALGLEGSVQGDKTDPQNWLNVLQSVNVPTDTVAGGVGTIQPLALFLLDGVPGDGGSNLLNRAFLPDSRGKWLIETLQFPDVKSAKNELMDEGKTKPITPT